MIVVQTTSEPPVLSTASTPDTLMAQGFLLNVFGSAGTYVSEWSADTLQWLPLSTNTSVGFTYQVVDPATTNSPQRFYRVRRL
jgi:hypothetical protein